MTDIVERLRAFPAYPAYQPDGYLTDMLDEAAATIEQLRARIAEAVLAEREVLCERLDICEAQAREIERLREEVQSLTEELAYHGVYPNPLISDKP